MGCQSTSTQDASYLCKICSQNDKKILVHNRIRMSQEYLYNWLALDICLNPHIHRYLQKKERQSKKSEEIRDCSNSLLIYGGKPRKIGKIATFQLVK